MTSAAKRNLKLTLGAALLLLAVGCLQPPAQIEISGRTMGTTYSVKFFPPTNDFDPTGLQQEIDRRLVEINQQMSTYIPDSELSRFNQSKAGDWFPVSTELAEVVSLAKQINHDSDGAFDVTVGPMVNLWNFGPDHHPEKIPSDEAIAAALANIGDDKLEVRLDPPALKKSVDGLYVDLSAIAKGYGVDKIAELLLELNRRSFMVEIGGEVRAGGTKPNGAPWRIAIEKPIPGARSIQEIVELSQLSLATSGDYRKFFEANGQTFSHTIDPKTGKPLAHTLASVSVLHADCASSDALATTLMVLGPDQGYNWAEEQELAVLFLIRGKDGPVVRRTSLWPNSGD
ncbi:FAD:protein FMN transferase [Blastopirellula retiformator]|uniref:FAD:protein FMN transferase n=1 Tax=Blastopirellula retiformator TaxID=2527970 RepID=A0A5C5VN93_9BACT|nr:FAD:protein FMN transferase [Blastopirellula retiformator]TWT39537.1 Thiamine biosynthesis lipoprotein ApbE precursor [Blastopirellula retiformator]